MNRERDEDSKANCEKKNRSEPKREEERWEWMSERRRLRGGVEQRDARLRSTGGEGKIQDCKVKNGAGK